MNPNYRNTTPTFLDANNSPSKKPVYYCKFGLVTGPVGTNSQVLPDQYRTGPIKGATVSRKRLMSVPASYSNSFNPITYESNISQLQFNLLNDQGEITRIVTNYTMKNRLVTIYIGYEGVNESEYQPIYSGQINNWTKSQDLTYYTFTVTDPIKMLITNPILGGHTQLTRDFKMTDVNCYVTSISMFAPKTDLFDGQGPRNFLRIGDNLYSYESMSSGLIPDGTTIWQFINYGTATKWKPNHAYTVGTQVSNNNFIYQCTFSGTSASSGGPAGTGAGSHSFNGMLLTTIDNNGQSLGQDHQAGESVDNYVLYEGNPIDLILQVMISTGTGTNYSGSGTNYDVLPNPQGVGIPQDLINIAGFEKIRNTYLSWMKFKGFFTDKQNALAFMRENIFQQSHVRIFTNRNGKIDVSASYVVLGTIDAVTFDDSNMASIPSFDANLMTGRYFYNQIETKLDYQPVADFYTNIDQTYDADSITKYQEISALSVDCKMVKTVINGERIIRRMTNIYLKRFSNPPPVITIKAFFSFTLSNPGDVCFLDSALIPNYKTGRDGGGKIICEIMTVQPDFSSGVMTMTLLGTGFNQNQRYKRISPRSILNGGTFPTYTNATEDQKLVYGFIGTKVGNVAQMSNGDVGYSIPA